MCTICHEADLVALCSSVLGFSFVFELSCLYLQIEKCVFMSWQFVCIVFYRRHTLEQLEMRHSDVRKELVTLKEALSQLTLQKEVLEDEKCSLAQALSRVLLYTFTQNAHSLTRPLIHLLTHSFVPSHSLTCSLVNSLTHSITPSLFHALTHSLIFPTLSLTNLFSQNTLFFHSITP